MMASKILSCRSVWSALFAAYVHPFRNPEFQDVHHVLLLAAVKAPFVFSDHHAGTYLNQFQKLIFGKICCS